MSDDDDKMWISISPKLALFLLSQHGCENFTNTDETGVRASGTCIVKNGLHPLAEYGADQPCASCIAWAGLQGPIKVSRW